MFYAWNHFYGVPSLPASIGRHCSVGALFACSLQCEHLCFLQFAVCLLSLKEVPSPLHHFSLPFSLSLTSFTWLSTSWNLTILSPKLWPIVTFRDASVTTRCPSWAGACPTQGSSGGGIKGFFKSSLPYFVTNGIWPGPKLNSECQSPTYVPRGLWKPGDTISIGGISKMFAPVTNMREKQWRGIKWGESFILTHNLRDFSPRLAVALSLS